MRLRVLGGLDLAFADGAPAENVTRQLRLLLGCLALAGSKGLSRSELCALFWPDRPAAQARNSLRQGLAALRKLLASDGGSAPLALHSDLENVRLASNAQSIDVHCFELGCVAADVRGWVEAAQAYGGEVFAGVSVPAEIEEWLAPLRRHCQFRALELVEHLSGAEDPVALDAAEPLAERLLASAPAAEEAHRSLMRVHLRRGRASAALRQFEQCKAALARELQAAPDGETLALLAQARAGSGAGETAKPPPVDKHSGTRPSVAVMAFENLGEAADEYFADGVVEEITAALSRIRDFFVIARQSAFAYKDRFVDVREIGRELGVAYVVEGTVRRGGERLRISVQLVDAASRAQLWSDRYEGAGAEVFEFQDRIAAHVAGALHPEIRRAEIEAAIRKPRGRLGAYDLVMRAYPKLWGQTAAAINEAMPLLEEAIGIDPSYGRAHALLAWCHALKSTYLWSDRPQREIEAAVNIVARARNLVGEDPTAMTALGAALSLSGDSEAAADLIEGALALDPNNAWAWTRLGWNCVYGGRNQDALAHFDKAMRLSPLDPFAFNMKMGRGAALVQLGRVKEAVGIAREVVRAHPDVTWALRQLASWSAMDGDIAAAREAGAKLMAAHPDFTIERYLSIPIFTLARDYHARMADGLRQAGVPER